MNGPNDLTVEIETMRIEMLSPPSGLSIGGRIGFHGLTPMAKCCRHSVAIPGFEFVALAGATALLFLARNWGHSLADALRG